MRSVRLFGKSIPLLAIVAIAMSAGMAGAALLSYYGKITTTVDVQQSVLVDGQDYTGEITDVIPEPAPGGENFCFNHTLTNRASIPAKVRLEASCSAVDHNDIPMNADGVTVTYLKLLGYSAEGTTYEIVGDYYPVDFTVKDGDCKVTWTFDMIGDKELSDQDKASDGRWNYGLAISLDGEKPAFQIHNNDGTDASYDWGTHLYSPYLDGWVSKTTNTLVEDLDWVTCTGDAYIANNADGIFTVTIDKCKLGPKFHWAIWCTAGGFWTVGGYSSYPDGFMWDEVVTAGNYVLAEIAEETNEITIPSGETIDFAICYSFDIAIAGGTYTITTTIVPA